MYRGGILSTLFIVLLEVILQVYFVLSTVCAIIILNVDVAGLCDGEIFAGSRYQHVTGSGTFY